MKMKIVLTVVVVLMLTAVWATAGVNDKIFDTVFGSELESKITIDTNKLHYGISETVEITYTNVGKAVAGSVIGTARPVIPQMIEVTTGKILYLTDPTLCYPCVMMYGVLEPGDSLILYWDQQYYGYYGDTFIPSEQVPEGGYYVELGYWKVVGDYLPPYYVPGGPPDRYARSETFTISDI